MYSQQSYGFIKDFWQCYVSNFIRNGSKNLDLRKYYASFFYPTLTGCKTPASKLERSKEM